MKVHCGKIDLCVTILCLLLTTSVGVASALPTGLVAWWSGESNAQDVSGNGYDATLVNGAQAGVPGLKGGAFQFNGVNAIANTSLHLPQTGTLDFWVNPATFNGAHGLVGTFGQGNGSNRLWMTATGPQGGPGVGPNRLVVNLGDCCRNEIDLPNPLAVGTWTHLALTFDYPTQHATLYVNGYAAASSSLRPTTPLSFGGVTSDFGQNFFLNGRLDEVQLFHGVLNDSEIQGIFTSGQTGSAGVPPLDCLAGGPERATRRTSLAMGMMPPWSMARRRGCQGSSAEPSNLMEWMP
ncbi:MAG TPA: LamG domain-containing protein [Candidatus Tectomicrobia bacterium]